jgi:hypothetical protein
LIGKYEGKRSFLRLSKGLRMMLERILETEGMGLWIGFDWPRIASKGELL